jgi:hypothetical protein
MLMYRYCQHIDAMDISSDDLLHDASADSSAFTSSGQASSIEDAAISGAAKMHAKFSGTLKQSRKLNTGHIGEEWHSCYIYDSLCTSLTRCNLYL